jgi:hypothetical protein
MNTNTTNQTEEKARVRSEYEGTGRQRKWNLFIGEEPYGFVHANAEAVDRVAAFKKPIRAELALEEEAQAGASR